MYPTSRPEPQTLAIIAATETTREEVTWSELRTRVQECAAAIRAHGIKAGDRVAGYLANHVNAVVVMLAATFNGAIWSGVSPDTGVTAVLDRLTQIEPVILFADNGVSYNGKTHDGHQKVSEICADLPSLRNVVIFENIPSESFNISTINLPSDCSITTYANFRSVSSLPQDSSELKPIPLPPDHPVYILYSSGTTGVPKPIVHSSLGTLLQHKKEHVLHCDIRPGDRLFYFTTTTWMMWHWLVSGLASGATIVLYDGSPFQPHGQMSMPLLIDELQITHFGTSAKYLSVLEQAKLQPCNASSKPRPANLTTLRAIYSTGSPLPPSTFTYIYDSFPPRVQLASITGGTDIISLFGAPCPFLLIHAGEIQCLGLGMRVEVWDPDTGRPATSDSDGSTTGELVCTVPFPSQPITFWPPPPSAQGMEKYKSAYFTQFFHPDKPTHPIWHHGDHVRLVLHSESGGGHTGLVMLGRSDTVLNPSGIRFGSSEIYNVLLRHFPSSIVDAVCVGMRRSGDLDETVVLFVQLADSEVSQTQEGEEGEEGKTEINEALQAEIKSTIATSLTRRHVPAIVDACPGIPVTANGKKVEGVVKAIVCGDVKAANRGRASVVNSGCLTWFEEWARRQV
ncbi:MAG: hypothetical protein Q9160_002292 [Pyrenula sp. 1 TL-2023]